MIKINFKLIETIAANQNTTADKNTTSVDASSINKKFLILDPFEIGYVKFNFR